MKTKATIILVVLLNTALFLNAQPQWKFHVAFEDATGTKDTIWFIWDTTATLYGNDSLLGEYSAYIDYNKFNVYIEWVDTVKTIAFPYDFNFENTIESINYELPITISWDTSLFYADWLPPEPIGWVNIAWLSSDYFFNVNNTGEDYFDMHPSNTVLSPDSLIVGDDPWFWDPVHNFPIGIGLGQDTLVLIEETSHSKNITYPNPVNSNLYLNPSYNIISVNILDLNGNIVLSKNKINDYETINVQFLKQGIYIIQFINKSNRLHYEKFIKQN